MTKRMIYLLIVVLVLSISAVSAATRLQKLTEDRYLITLKKWSAYGGQGRVLRQLNVKAGSLCVLLGYQWFEIKDQTSHGRGFVKTAAGTYEVKFHYEQEDEDMIECEALASEEEKQKMKKTLEKATK